MIIDSNSQDQPKAGVDLSEVCHGRSSDLCVENESLGFDAGEEMPIWGSRGEQRSHGHVNSNYSRILYEYASY
jgi:hypothetical protein